MIYCWFGILACIFISIYGYQHENKFFLNPLTVFGIEWAIILLFSSMQLWTLLLPDNDIYLMILLGILGYLLGYIISKSVFCNVKIKTNSANHSTNRKNSRYIPRYYLLYFLSILTIIYYATLTRTVFSQIQSFSLGKIIGTLRSDSFIGYSNEYINALAVLLFRPFSNALPAITAVDFWFGKRNKTLFVLNAILLLLRLLSSGGRSIILLFAVYFLLCAFVSLRRNSVLHERFLLRKRLNSKKTKRKITFVTITGALLFIIMTASRGTRLFQNVYIAFAIQPRMFEIWGDYVNTNHVIGYGVTSLFGFIYPVFYLFCNLLGMPMPSIITSIFDSINKTEIEWVWPGTGMRNNAYVSIFWYFYTDGRWLGILLGMFVFGCIVAKSFNCISRKKFNEKNMALYCLVLYAVMFSFVRFEFGGYSFALSVVYVLAFFYKKINLFDITGEILAIKTR